MLRTTAESLITDDTGRVIGVKATRYDGTPVTAYANKGVILATGGYAANIDMVLDTNVQRIPDRGHQDHQPLLPHRQRH